MHCVGRIITENLQLVVGDQRGDVEFAALQLEDPGVGVLKHLERHSVDVRNTRLPIVRVLLQHDFDIGRARDELERSRADGMLEERVPLLLVCGLREDRGREHCQVRFKRCPNVLEVDDASTRIGRLS
jgi:hypothetical protein